MHAIAIQEMASGDKTVGIHTCKNTLSQCFYDLPASSAIKADSISEPNAKKNIHP